MYSKILSQINTIERKFPVDSIKYRDIFLWPFIRFFLFEEFTESQTLIDYDGSQKFTFNKIIKWLFEIFFFIGVKLFFRTHEQKIQRTRVLFYFNGIDRTYFKGAWVPKQAYSFFLELERRNVSYLCLENISRNNFRQPRSNRALSVSFTLRKLYYKFQQLLNPVRNSSKNSESLRKFVDFFNDLKTGIRIREQYLLSNADILFRESAYFEKILKKTHAEAVFVIGYYAFSWALHVACRRMGIPSSDIQHGIAGKNLHPYGRWEKVPVQGYNMLPEYFLSWTHEDRNGIIEWAGKTSFHKAIITGNSWVDFFKRISYAENAAYDDLFKLKMERSGKKFAVLFTHQPPFDFPDWVKEFIVENQKAVYWIIRLHPTIIQKRYYIDRHSQLFEIVDYNDLALFPLPILLRHVDLHLTGWSASAFEAAEFGVQTVFLDRRSELYFSKKLVDPLFKTAYSPFALKRALSRIVHHDFPESALNEDLLSEALSAILPNHIPS